MDKGSRLSKLIETVVTIFSFISHRKAWIKHYAWKSKNQGYTLIELLATLTILGIIAAIAVPNVLGVIEKAKQDVCQANLLQVERNYETYLVLENREHSDVIFALFLQDYGEEVCPELGDITYVDGKVQFSEFPSDDGNGNDGDESVPFL